MNTNLIKQCIAEFIGTFALVFFGCGSMILYELNPNAISPDAIPIIFGLIIAVMIYALGHISGAHFNPAVSLIFYIRKELEQKDFALYVLAQVVGGLIGVFLTKLLFRSTLVKRSK